MDNAHDEQKSTVSGTISRILIWIGLVLLAAGAVSAYPYIRSRLTPIPVHSAEEVHVTAQPEALPIASRAASPTAEPLLSPTQSASEQATPSPAENTPTPQPTPMPFPTPAVPSRIVIPSINVDAPVVTAALEINEVDGQPQSTWAVPAQYAAGWHATSAPLGVPGNTVLNGHNTTYGEVFRDLYRLSPGDIITLYSDDTPYTYVVSDTLILPEAGQPPQVRLENAHYVLPTVDERVTLVTCHPYGSLRNRLIVIALPIDDMP